MLVINLCIKAEFLTKQDIKEKSPKYLWVVQLTEYCKDTMALEDLSEGESEVPTTTFNCDQTLSEKQNKAEAVIKVLAKEVMRAIPSYQG
ncbi:hypothetical protein BCT55_21355 [Vibrio splendidus]|nr:hypothetical protein BCT55_21355 [Vibrio splendidus]